MRRFGVAKHEEKHEDALSARQGAPIRPGRTKTLIMIFVWFVLNISMGSITKWTYLYGKVCSSKSGACATYKFPFMVTAVHMLCSWAVCAAIIRRRDVHASRLSLREQAYKIVPLALVFSACVGLGNMSLTYIYPSFNQMLSSMTPLVTVLVSVALRGKRYNTWAWSSMPIICGGLLACSRTEVNYNSVGVLCVAGATTLRSVKTVMQEKLLDSTVGALDSVTLLHYFSPWAGLFLVTMSMFLEGRAPLALLLLPGEDGESRTGAGNVLVLLLLSGLNAAFLNISGTYLTAYVGAVMLQILGNVKACLSILVSIAIFGNPITPTQVVGVLVCLGGVWIYQRKGGPSK